MAANQATEYLDKLANAITSKEGLTAVSKTKQNKIAEIVTGLYVLSKPNFRTALGIDDSTYAKITKQLYSNSAAANYVTTAGKRLPSKLQTFTKAITTFGKLQKTEQQQFLSQLKQIHDDIGKSSA